jgi:hypothetical protein
VVVSDTALELSIRPQSETSSPSIVCVPFLSPNAKPVKRQIGADDKEQNESPMRPSKRRRLLLGIAKARAWYDELATGRVGSVREIAIREKTTHRHVRQMLPLAFVPPSFVYAAVNNQLESGDGLSKLVKELTSLLPRLTSSIT